MKTLTLKQQQILYVKENFKNIYDSCDRILKLVKLASISEIKRDMEKVEKLILTEHDLADHI